MGIWGISTTENYLTPFIFLSLNSFGSSDSLLLLRESVRTDCWNHSNVGWVGEPIDETKPT